ncbi:MAG: PKD domain-containing protein [bacterium]|nr:PKD domain-containing protein [bacterium]
MTVACNASSSSDPDGSITQYYWDFGDGSVKQGRIVQHQYTIHDDYNIELTVTDDDGATTTVSHPVVVEPPNQPPTCSFTFSPTSGLYPLVVTFDTSQCTDSDGQIASYRWDFGDATFGGGAAPTHQYNQKGTYTVKLKLTDDDGATSTATGTIQVFGLMPPINVAYELKENRSLFTINYVTRVTWNMNPVNADHGATIVQYKIFRKLPSESNYVLHTEVAAQDFNEYYDRLGSESIIYNYVVIAVDDHGRMSEFPSTYNSYRERKPRRIRE